MGGCALRWVGVHLGECVQPAGVSHLLATGVHVHVFLKDQLHVHLVA